VFFAAYHQTREFSVAADLLSCTQNSDCPSGQAAITRSAVLPALAAGATALILRKNAWAMANIGKIPGLVWFAATVFGRCRITAGAVIQLGLAKPEPVIRKATYRCAAVAPWTRGLIKIVPRVKPVPRVQVAITQFAARPVRAVTADCLILPTNARARVRFGKIVGVNRFVATAFGIRR